MRTNKPEVVAWYTPNTRDTLPVVALNDRSQRGEPLIRLSDYEALQAECEELVEALSIARDYVFSSLEEKKLALAGHPQMWRCEQDDLAIIDAALSTHLKGCE